MSKVGPRDSDATIGAQVERRIREIHCHDLNESIAAVVTNGPDRYAAKQTIEVEIDEKLNESTLEEVLNSTWRLLTESDGHGEEPNGRASAP